MGVKPERAEGHGILAGLLAHADSLRDHRVGHLVAARLGVEQRLQRRCRHERRRAVPRIEIAARSRVVPAAARRDRRFDQRLHQPRGLRADGFDQLLRHQRAILQMQQQLQRVDVPPAAHVVAADEGDLHALGVERLQHELQPVLHGLDPRRVLRVTGCREQAEARDRRATDPIADRRGVLVFPVDAAVRPLCGGVSFLQLQQGRDRGLGSGLDVERRGLRHREGSEAAG